MTTFPNVKVTMLVTKDPVFGSATNHADLPCATCMSRGEIDCYKDFRRATHLVEFADLLKVPMCQIHADEFVGDKR